MNKENSRPKYEQLAIQLVRACQRQDKLEFDRAIGDINLFGWHRGVMHSINYATITVLSLTHVGGLQSEFSHEFISGWQEVVASRHGYWLSVPDDLVVTMINRAKNGPRGVSDIPITIVAIRQVVLIETIASILSNGVERDFEIVIEASFLKAREVINGFLQSGELRFED